jgi:hypothetical protein
MEVMKMLEGNKICDITGEPISNGMLHAASHMLLQWQHTFERFYLAKFGYKLDMKVKYTYGILLYYWLPIGTYDKKFGNLNQISFII